VYERPVLVDLETLVAAEEGSCGNCMTSGGGSAD